MLLSNLLLLHHCLSFSQIFWLHSPTMNQAKPFQSDNGRGIYIYLDHVAIKNNFFITEDEKVSISFWEMRKFSCTIESFNPITTVPSFFFSNKWIEKCKTKGTMNKEKGVCYALGFLRYNVCMIPKWQVGENNSLDGCKTLQMM